MVWNITSFSDSLADLRITSYTYNVTNGNVGLFPVQDSWRINTETREITQATSESGLAGYKSPFWIGTSDKPGSTVDAYFGSYATVQQAETIQALGRNMSCWKVSLSWPSAAMQRWYDPATGIVVRIDTTRLQGGIQMIVRERAAVSNIGAMGSGTTRSDLWPYLEGSAVLAVGVVSLTLGYLYRSARKQTPHSGTSTQLS